MKRPSLREFNQIRKTSIETGVNKWAEGSCLVTVGSTKVLCTASVEEQQPIWKRQQNKTGGWVSAEYSMLPRAVSIRKTRENLAKDHRSSEISRLIGRSLRSVIDMEKLGKRTITIDCDVIQADGGTRCASITGGFVALKLAIKKLLDENKLKEDPISSYVSAISAGIFEDEVVLDLDFIEDSNSDIDANFVISEKGEFIEIQMTGEKRPFTAIELNKLLELSKFGCSKLIELQKQVLQ